MARPEGGAERIRAAYAKRHGRGRASVVAAFVVGERREILRTAVIEHLGHDLAALRICDVGCGGGGDLEYLKSLGALEERLAGTELLAGPLAVAQNALPRADLRLVDGFDLPWQDESFNLTWSSMALSSIIDDASRRQLFAEMQRVTKSGGLIAIYDFAVRKPTNRDVVAMTERRIHQLGPRPTARTPATPFLPLLPFVLRLPPLPRALIMRLLPRTHYVWTWAMPPADPDPHEAGLSK